MATIDEFQKIDIRVGTILEAIINQKARKPAYRLKLILEKKLGLKHLLHRLQSDTNQRI